MTPEQINKRLRKIAFGRPRIAELERVALFLGPETPEGKLVGDAVEVLTLLRADLRGGPLEPPVRNWNKGEK